MTVRLIRTTRKVTWADAYEQFTRVRRLLAILQDFGVEPFVWESGHPISARILLNIMQASDDSAAEFERLSDLGHEA